MGEWDIYAQSLNKQAELYRFFNSFLGIFLEKLSKSKISIWHFTVHFCLPCKNKNVIIPHIINTGSVNTAFRLGIAYHQNA